MVVGVPTRCIECGKPVVSCALPAFCFKCNPENQNLIEKLKEKGEKIRDVIKGKSDKPMIVDDQENKD